AAASKPVASAAVASSAAVSASPSAAASSAAAASVSPSAAGAAKPAASGSAPASSAAVSAAPAQAVNVTLALGYIPNVQFAPFYVAQAKGFYKDEGINISFDNGTSPDLIKSVGAGKFQFALADPDTVISAREQSIPVTYVAGF